MSIMTKKKMAAKAAEGNGVTNAQAQAVMDAIVAIISENLKSGEAVVLNGLGSFKVVEKPERKGTNPLTGEKITIPARKAVKFKATATLLRALNDEKE